MSIFNKVSINLCKYWSVTVPISFGYHSYDSYHKEKYFDKILGDSSSIDVSMSDMNKFKQYKKIPLDVNKALFQGVFWPAFGYYLLENPWISRGFYKKEFVDFENDFNKWKLKNKIDQLPDSKHIHYATIALDHKHN